jgi:hypothetical protein
MSESIEGAVQRARKDLLAVTILQCLVRPETIPNFEKAIAWLQNEHQTQGFGLQILAKYVEVDKFINFEYQAFSIQQNEHT